MRARGKKRSSSNLKKVILQYVNNNLRGYIILIILFLIGIVLGVIFINNTNENQKEQIGGYITGFVDSLKGDYQIDSTKLLKTSITNNVKLAVILWFVSSTVIGVFLVYGIIVYRGFCIGYTAASIMATLGTGKGILFLITTLLLQNILFIPCIISLGVSGMKLYKSIMKDKRRDNIKVEIFRHTLFSAMMLILIIISSFIETYISTPLLMYTLKYL